MVEFGSGYYMPMDRSYEEHGHSHHHSPVASAQKATGDVGLSMGDFGFSFGLGPVPNVQAIAAKVRPGSKTVELVFTGAGKGSGQSQTPEYYGKKQRQALREITKANRVDFTTHSTVGIAGLAGMDQGGNFSKASKNFSLQEVKRAIEFAADVGRGGPIVVHTGEFTRPIVDAAWNQQQGDQYKEKFRMFEGEEERSAFRVVDNRTGSLLVEARKNLSVARPVWLAYDEKSEEWKKREGQKEYRDAQGNTVKKGDYIDYEGNRVDMAKRVPLFDPEKGEFITELYNWDKMKEEAKLMTKRAQEEFDRWESLSEKERQESLWREKIESAKISPLGKKILDIKPEEAYVIATLETNAAHARGWALQYAEGFQEEVKALNKLSKVYGETKELERVSTPEERERMKKQVADKYGGGYTSPEDMLPSDIIERQMKMLRLQLEKSQQAASSQIAQAEEAVERIRHVQSAETYALQEACDSYADLGIAAMRQSDRLRKEGRLQKPLAVALENLFPEQYGSHPDELKMLVLQSREAMIKKLTDNYKLSEEEARQRAEQHITATLDTGHLNIWRKYWKGDPNKTIKENDDNFNTWIMAKVKELAKDKIVGHVHIDDNYGYHDDHLAPGEGNTPIREMVKILRDSGYKGELIVEPGADFANDVSGFHSVMKTWRHFELPVYGKGSGLSARRTWGDVGYGFFGQNLPPYFVFGSYSPSEDWTLWSGVPLE
ncbi:hypothetical protein HY496_03670 [Candidatus Woesearchaeota archaeon]|nr:hypothetical protein [Candidatus Woesearchaeota archaeon]